MSSLDGITNLLEKLVLKFGGEEGEKLVRHHHLTESVIDKIGAIMQDDDICDKLYNCTDDELEVINSRLTMIINTLNINEEVTE